MSTNRNIYRRSIAPHNARVMADGGEVTGRINAAIELMRFYEEQKDSIKLFYFPALTGNKIRTSGLNKFVSKGYSLNSPQQTFGAELVVNGKFTIDSNWSKQSGWTIPNNGLAVYDGVVDNRNINQNVSLKQNTNYVLSFKVISGTARLQVVDSTQTYDYGLSIAAYPVGSYSLPFNTSTYSGLVIFARNISGGTAFSITDVSIVEVLSTDLSQSTSTSQPYLSGSIAPNEIPCIENPNGGKNFLTYSPISFASNEGWSLSTIINYSIANNYNSIVSGSSGGSVITIHWGANKCISLRNSLGTIAYFTLMNSSKYIGKIVHIHLVANKNNEISLFVNGEFIESKGIINSMNFINLLRSGDSATDYNFNGSFYGLNITSSILSQQQITQEYNLLRNFIPEMESVTIGNQTWTTSNCRMAATPMGNVIPEVQSAATWATSKTLYDNAYDAQSGTVEQKTYAGVKAAAMWAHYNNEVSLGAIYGKLYNWFAIKLLQMDIDYYNTSNPTTPWGWRVPTESNYTALSTYLGGNSISGGKMKMPGTTYWSIPNTGADNSSGFSSLPSGYRGNTGVFSSLNTLTEFWSVSTNIGYYIPYNSTSLTGQTYDKIGGFSLRLIKT